MANGLIWLIIVAVAAFVFWLGHDMITGPRRQREDVKRMLAGLDTTKDIMGVSLKAAHEPSSPFAPGSKQGKRRKLTTGS
jgi:hypothetical protein